MGRGRDDELGFTVDGGWNSCFFDLNGIDLEDPGAVIATARLVMEGRERRERERKRHGASRQVMSFPSREIMSTGLKPTRPVT